MAHQQHYQSPFGDTTLTKVFVGGLAWETPIDVMRAYFQQFGEIYEAVIINDKNTGKSKGYGFVTFRDAESAKRACDDPNPMIGGRRANCNIASLGRPRPSPPRGRNQYQGGGGTSPIQYRSIAAPPPQQVVYPPYGYTTYAPDYGYHQAMYSPHVQQTPYYNQVYGSSSSTMGAPYYYGYSIQAPRGGALSNIPPAQRIQGPSYLYYPAQVEPHSSSYAPPPPPHLSPAPIISLSFPPSTEAGALQTTSSETEVGPATMTSSNA
ncbi:hypothetical protein CASFOL_034587 [Castilleja foliolosa]|uniref:RRM domain-containing protein n=1 Tax=Castilleja foliolosa TaxID=1961234 RepID=A0ABD3BSJ2_9LAMI